MTIFKFFGCNKIFTEEMRNVRKALFEKIVCCL